MRIVVGSDQAGFRPLVRELEQAFMAPPSGEERRWRRPAKMKAIEARYRPSPAGVRRNHP